MSAAHHDDAHQSGARRTDSRRGDSGDRSRGITLLPSAITLLALCLGLSSVKFAMDGELGVAYALIAAAAVFDALDGFIARLLAVTSRMGAELDSLSDAVAFGVAPTLVLYVTLLEGTRGGWLVSLVFVVCIILRLARYNTLLDDTDAPPYAKQFFTGIPSPAAAIAVLVPVAVSLQWGEGWWTSTILVALWVLVIAGLVISRLPSFSISGIKVPSRYAAPILVLVGAAFGGLITYPYVMIIVLTAAYLAHLPFAARRLEWAQAHHQVWTAAKQPRRTLRRPSVRRLGSRPMRTRRLAGRRRR